MEPSAVRNGLGVQRSRPCNISYRKPTRHEIDELMLKLAAVATESPSSALESDGGEKQQADPSIQSLLEHIHPGPAFGNETQREQQREHGDSRLSPISSTNCSTVSSIIKEFKHSNEALVPPPPSVGADIEDNLTLSGNSSHSSYGHRSSEKLALDVVEAFPPIASESFGDTEEEAAESYGETLPSDRWPIMQVRVCPLPASQHIRITSERARALGETARAVDTDLSPSSAPSLASLDMPAPLIDFGQIERNTKLAMKMANAGGTSRRRSMKSSRRRTKEPVAAGDERVLAVQIIHKLRDKVNSRNSGT